MTRILLACAIAAAVAAPALAQSAPPPPPLPPGADSAPTMRGNIFERRGDRGGYGMFRNVSPEAQAVLTDAFTGPNPASDRQDVRAARDAILRVLEADRLDTAALRRAMDEERRIIDRQQTARQERLLSAYQKLSLEDRRALASDGRQARDRVARMIMMRAPRPPMPPAAPTPTSAPNR